MPTLSVAELAQAIGGTVIGDGTRLVSSCNSLMDATPDQVSVFHISKYAKELESTRAGCIIRSRCTIDAGTVIGSDGFAYAQANGVHYKMPQHGGLIIEDDVEIGCHSIIERGALNPTRVQKGTKIGSHVIIGHNCQIGPA